MQSRDIDSLQSRINLLCNASHVDLLTYPTTLQGRVAESVTLTTTECVGVPD